MTKSAAKQSGLPVVHERAAGIDIGSRFHVVAVTPDCSDEPVQTFQAFTGDLQRMADWLVSVGVKTVAMESTGVYWRVLGARLRDTGRARHRGDTGQRARGPSCAWAKK